MEIDDDIRGALSNDKLEKKELAKMVYTGKTITMLQDALIKCLEGLTSFEEVYRTIEIENEDDDNYENEIASEIKDSIPVVEEEEESDSLLDEPVKKKEEGIIILPPSFGDANIPTVEVADIPSLGDDNTTEVDASQESVEVTIPGVTSLEISPTTPLVDPSQMVAVDPTQVVSPIDASQTVNPAPVDATQMVSVDPSQLVSYAPQVVADPSASAVAAPDLAIPIVQPEVVIDTGQQPIVAVAPIQQPVEPNYGQYVSAPVAGAIPEMPVVDASAYTVVPPAIDSNTIPKL